MEARAAGAAAGRQQRWARARELVPWVRVQAILHWPPLPGITIASRMKPDSPQLVPQPFLISQ